MKQLGHVIYISHGNMPTRWAHSMQSMKMAEALAERADRLEALTQCHWLHRWQKPFDYARWYGLSRPIEVVELPSWRAPLRRPFEHDGLPCFAKAAVAYAEKVKPDLVWTRSVAAGGLCLRRGLDTIVETHSWRVGRRFSKLSLDAPNMRALVTTTRLLGDLFREAGAPEGRLVAVPNAVDLKQFDDLPSRVDARRRWGIDNGDYVVGYCGHLYDEKGIPTLIEAARLSRSAGIRWSVFGGWPKDVALRQAEAVDLPDVHWHGFVPKEDVPSAIACADVLLLPNSAKHESARWTCPLKLFEYMASRRPVVATDLPGIREILEPGEDCWMAPPDNPQALADAVLEVRSQPEEASRRARRARAKVEQMTWRNRVDRVLSQAFQA